MVLNKAEAFIATCTSKVHKIHHTVKLVPLQCNTSESAIVFGFHHKNFFLVIVLRGHRIILTVNVVDTED